MENNWRKKVNLLLDNCTEHHDGCLTLLDKEDVIDIILTAMDLVFEATKKECADKATVTKYSQEIDEIVEISNFIRDDISLHNFEINKESILNINKPDL